MILRARDEHGICLVGDKEWDIMAAKAAGIGATVLISDHVPDSKAKPVLQAVNLREAFDFFVSSGLFARSG